MYFGECSCDLEIISSDILKTLFSLPLTQKDAENYRENYVLLENGAKV